MNKAMSEKRSAKSGDIIVIYGRTDFDRDVITYTDAKDLVAYFRERDYPDADFSNEEYMRMVGNKLKSAAEGLNIPSHNEEAFVEALFRMGLCGKTTLN